MGTELASLLCLVSILLHERPSETKSISPETSSFHAVTIGQAVAGLPRYRRFFANDSLVGQAIPCTSEEKVCFQYNLLFDTLYLKCYEIGGGSPIGCDFRPNVTEFKFRSGHLNGACKQYQDPCPGYRMAYDGRCYQEEIVRDVICGCDAKPTRHLLGGVECRCSPATPIHVEQPPEEGRCRIPDLRFPHNFKSIVKDLLITATHIYCSDEQSKCFSEGKVWFREWEGCFSLLERGPCPENHVVALEGHAASEGKLQAVCTHERGGCPSGQKRMTFDDKCHEDTEVNLLAPFGVNFNVFGQNEIKTLERPYYVFFPQLLEPNVCYIGVGPHFGILAGDFPKPPCGANDKNHCSLYEIEDSPPEPE